MNVSPLSALLWPFAMNIIHPLWLRPPYTTARPRVQTRPGLINSFWVKRPPCSDRIEEKITTRGPIYIKVKSKRIKINIYCVCFVSDCFVAWLYLFSGQATIIMQSARNQYKKCTNNHVWCVAFVLILS